MNKTKRSPKKNAALDRRDFIKTGAAAAALGSLSIERGAFAQASDTVKVALIGCGGRGGGDSAGASCSICFVWLARASNHLQRREFLSKTHALPPAEPLPVDAAR